MIHVHPRMVMRQGATTMIRRISDGLICVVPVRAPQRVEAYVCQNPVNRE